MEFTGSVPNSNLGAAALADYFVMIRPSLEA